MSTLRPSRFAPLLCGIPLLLAAQSSFAFISVGASSNCQLHKIQDAIDELLNSERHGDYGNSPDDTRIVVANGSFSEALSISSSGISDARGAQVTITGGFDRTCDHQEVGTGGATTIDAGAHGGASVLTIRGNSTVHLNTLVMTGGTASNHGGGIDFNGTGLLDINQTLIKDNRAQNGGGIYVNGQVPGLTLSLRGGTEISSNTASQDGGGISAEGETFLFANDAGSITLIDNNATGHSGGGINFQGRGSVTLGSTQIVGNNAGEGGGIYVNASDPTQLFFDDGVFIVLNTALSNGGGMTVGGKSTVFAQAASVPTHISSNTVVAIDGFGGGVDLRGPAKMTFAGTIDNNTAGFGGGLSMRGGQDDGQHAVATLLAANATSPISILNNAATQKGGGVYITPHQDSFNTSFADLCAGDFRINGNSAPSGSALFGDSETNILSITNHSSIGLNKGTAICPAVAHVCTQQSICNQINDNISGDGEDNASTIVMREDGFLDSARFSMRGNSGAHLIYGHLGGDEISGHINAKTALFADNHVSGELFVSEYSMDFSGVTIAHNEIDASHVIRASDHLSLTNSIVAESVVDTVDFAGNNDRAKRLFDFVLTNPQDATLNEGGALLFGSPAFVQVGSDYHLSSQGSLGLDAAGVQDDESTDLDFSPRDVDLAEIPDAGTPRDLGAYELQRFTGNSDVIFANGFQ